MCLAPRTIDGYREALFEKLKREEPLSVGDVFNWKWSCQHGYGIGVLFQHPFPYVLYRRAAKAQKFFVEIF